MAVRFQFAKKIQVLLAASAWGVGTLAAGAAGAHPGHGAAGDSWSPIHFLSEPEHVVGLFAVAVCAIGANRLLRARRAGH